MPTLGKVLWTALTLLGISFIFIGLAVSGLQLSYPIGTDTLLFSIGGLSFLTGLYIWKTDLFN